MRTQHGFSLLETLVATAVLATGIGALAQLAFMAMKATERAHVVSFATIAAQEKLEELRARAAEGDWAPSPPGSLGSNTAGFHDFVSLDGRPLAQDTPAPAAGFTRRWSIGRAGASDLVVIQVRVVGAWGEVARLITAVATRLSAVAP